MPCGLNVFRFRTRGFAKGHQVRLVAHEKIGEPSEESRVVDGLSQHVGLYSRQRQKTRKHIRFTGKPAKYGDRRFMRILGGWPVVFFVTQHLLPKLPISQPNLTSVTRWGIMESVLWHTICL